MKVILTYSLVCLIALISSCKSVPTQESKFIVRTLAKGSSKIEVIKLNRLSGQCWRARKDHWEKLPSIKTLPDSDYDMSLLSADNGAWVVVLWNVKTGDAFYFSSKSGKWKTIK